MDSPTTTTTPSILPATGVRFKQTLAYFLAFIALGSVLASLGPTLPTLARNTGSTLGESSFLFSGRSLGALLGALLSGRLYDRHDGHPVLALTMLLMAAMLFLAPLLSSLWLLALVLLLVGVSEATFDVGINTLLVWAHGKKVGPYMNALHFFFGVGAFLSPILVAAALRASDQVLLAYWALALMLLPVLFWLLRLPSPQSRQTTVADPARSFDGRLVLLVALFLALYVGVEVSFAGWIYSYAVALDLADTTQAAYLTSAFWATFTVGRLVSIPLAGVLRPRLMLLLNLLGALVSAGALVLGSGSPALTWAGTLGMGFSLAAIFPTTISLAERRLTITGRVTSFFFAGASTGAMTIPWLVGQLFATISPQATMITLAVVLVLALALLNLLWRRDGLTS